ncbi:DNA/RNA non-specific endonuclease [Sphingomonas psychrotolerans]|uniref:DNA/RNA non-specific endonuclease n=1 Tax=Sphingomonas psychrotolerans TaxID=1327635 RepID=A0ABU3N5R6_9SPHN|nr:DNA/RNA non-specific endonuclease [Sphingomonas psychrotolerans]MDT8759092.1 DNA/RNA non-specific endonuclease [Sphingomonas psychrotolerans]
MQQQSRAARVQTSFEIYLRTGRRPGSVERKFNPWHDPEDGRFTFREQGRYFPGGSDGTRSSRVGARRATAPPPKSADPLTQETDAARSARENDPDNPRNHQIYVVRNGDNLTRIAATRKGLTVKDLAWLNGISVDRPLRIGQRLKIPHQRYLDEGRDAKNKFLALGYYMQTHGGRLPPNPANPPSLESQILDHNWRQEIRGSYNYYIDAGSDFRRVFGLLTLTDAPKRSRKSQREVPERGPKDDGGHYVAPRFSGPTDWFNHFAQDLHINRGAYRVMEDQWYKAAAAGKKVFIDIRPVYPQGSRRPSEVQVTWYINGERDFQRFKNQQTDKEDGRR